MLNIDHRAERTDVANPTCIEAYRPAEIARLIECAGVSKSRLPLISLIALGALAGAFIAFGALFYLAVLTGADAGHGPTRMAAGAAFSLGLILVVVGGAELFTGNVLIVMAWVDRLVSTAALVRNWGIVYVANLAGAATIVTLVWVAGYSDGPIGSTAARVAAHKMALGTWELIGRGILCNALVCLAVWLSMAARDVAGKIFAILWPITAFVALGFEHSVANMFLLPFGLLSSGGLDFAGLVAIGRNLAWVSLGNVLGGALGVALAYWAAYRPTDRGDAVMKSGPPVNAVEPVTSRPR